MARAILTLAVLLATGAAGAQAVSDDCDWIASPANIVEPWVDHSRSFANGAIRIALLDTSGEPVCCSMHLLILSPSVGEEGPAYRQCHILSDRAQGVGFHDIDFAGIAASYDPALGLRLEVPVWRYTDGRDRGRPGQVAVRINQATGSVVVEAAGK